VRDATAEIVAAAAELASAIARADLAELVAADARLATKALPPGRAADAVDAVDADEAVDADDAVDVRQAATRNAVHERIRLALHERCVQNTVYSVLNTVFGAWAEPAESDGPSARASREPSNAQTARSISTRQQHVAQPALLMTVALALVARLAAPPRRSLAAWSTRARALLARTL
jgi:hypothetical protein